MAFPLRCVSDPVIAMTGRVSLHHADHTAEMMYICSCSRCPDPELHSEMRKGDTVYYYISEDCVKRRILVSYP